MLCLSRKLNEALVITTASGETIRVFIADIDRGRVRLAVEADRSVIIDREEIAAAKLRGAKAAP